MNVEIQRLLVTAKVDTYADMVEFAQKAEECEIKWKDYLNAKRSDFKNWKNTTGSSSQGQATDKGKRKMRQTCRYCEKYNHKKSECWKKAKKCLKCGSPKHLIEECPLVKRSHKPEPQTDV